MPSTNCPQCRQSIQVSVEALEAEIRCPRCQAVFVPLGGLISPGKGPSAAAAEPSRPAPKASGRPAPPLRKPAGASPVPEAVDPTRRPAAPITQEAEDSDSVVIDDEPPRVRRLARSTGARDRSKEPWFYKYLEIAAYVLMIPAGLALILGLLFSAFLIVQGLASRDPRAGIAAGFLSAIWMIYVVLVCLAAIFWSAVILLLVDIGRRLRSIERNTKDDA